MSVSEINILEVRNFQVSKYNRKLENLQMLYKKAFNDFEKIVQLIIEKYNPKRIYQWGSLLNKEHFSEISDIDIAVEGLPCAETYFNLLNDVENMTDFPLDIVEIENIHALHKNMILKKGKLIYERNQS